MILNPGFPGSHYQYLYFIIKFGDFTQERCGACSTEKKKCAASPSLQAKVVKQKKTDDGIEVKLAFSLLDHIMERLFVNLVPRVLSYPPYGTRLIICHFNFEICA